MEKSDLGAETCSKATPQAATHLGPTGYDQGETPVPILWGRVGETRVGDVVALWSVEQPPKP